MADKEVASLKARVEVDLDPLGRGCDKAKQQLGFLGNVAEQVFTQAIGFGMGQIGVEAAKKFAGALLAPVKLMADIAQQGSLLAARNETLGTSLEVVGRNAGWTATQLQAAVEGVRDMGITTGVATTTVTRFIQAELATGKSSGVAADEMKKLARTAQDLAVVAGVNSSEALETLMQATSSLQPRLLRQFGIVEGLEPVFAKYAQGVGKTADQLTESEQRQAMLNRIFEEGVKVAGTYETAMGTVNKQMGSMERYQEEAKAAIGQGFLPVLRAGVQLQTEFWKGLEAAAPAINAALAPAIERAARGILGLGTAAKTTGAIISSNWKPAVAAAAGVLTMALLPSLDLLPTAIGVAILDFQEMAAAAWASLGPYALLAGAIFGLVKAGQSLVAEADRKQAAFEDEASTIARTATSYEEYSRRMDAAVAKTSALAPVQMTAYGMTAQIGGIAKMTADELAGYQSRLAAVQDSTLNLALAGGRLVTDLDIIGTGVTNTGGQLDGWLARLQQNQAQLGELSAAWGDAFKSDKVQQAFQGLEQVALQHQQAMTDITSQGAQADLDATFNANLAKAQAIQQHQAQMLQLEQQYQANKAILEAAGDAEGLAALAQSYNNERATQEQQFQQSQTLAENNNSVQAQIQKRGLIVQEIAQQTSYIAQLQAQYRQVDESLKLALIEAQKKPELAIGAAEALLTLEQTSSDNRLTVESSYAAGSLDIAQKLATGKIATAEELVAAVSALEQGKTDELAAAKAKLAALKEDLKNFKVTLPPLNLPALPTTAASQFATGVGTAVKESTQKALADATSDMARGIEAGKKSISDLLGFDLPRGWEEGLDRFAESSLVMARKFASIWNRGQAELEAAAKTAGGIDAMGQAVGSMSDAAAKAGALADVDLAKINTGFDKLWAAFQRVPDFLKRAGTAIGGDDAVKKASELAGNIKGVMDILSIGLTISAPGAGFETRLDEWLRASAVAGKKLVEGLGKADALWGSATLARAANLAKSVRDIMSLLDLGLTVKSPSPDFEAKFELWLDATARVGARLITGLQNAQKTWGEDGLARVAVLAKDVDAVMGLLKIGLDVQKPQADFGKVFEDWLAKCGTIGARLIAGLQNAERVYGVDALDRAAKISESVTKIMGLLGIDLSISGAGLLFPYQLVAYFDSLDMAFTRAMAWLNTASTTYTQEGIADAATVGESTKKILDLLNIKLDVSGPTSAQRFADTLDRYFGSLDTAFQRAATWLRAQAASRLPQELADAGTIAEHVTKIMSVLGVDLAKVAVPQVNFPAVLDAYFNGLDLAFQRSIATLAGMTAKYGPEGPAMLAQASELAGSVKGVMDLLGVKLDIKAPPRDFMTGINSTVTALSAGVDRIIPELQTLEMKWGAALPQAQATAESVAATFDAINSIAQSVADAADVGGIDVGAARALLNQMSLLLNPPTGYVSPEIGNIVPGMPWAGVPGAGGAAPDYAAVVAALNRLADFKPSATLNVHVDVGGIVVGDAQAQLDLVGAENIAQDLYVYATQNGSLI